MLRTPAHWNRALSHDQVPGFLQQIREEVRSLPDLEDALSHIRAAEQCDLTERFGGSMARAAEAIRAEMLIVVNAHDRLTTPEPSREFAALARARLLETHDDCGHQSFRAECAGGEIGSAVRTFLERADGTRTAKHRKRN